MRTAAVVRTLACVLVLVPAGVAQAQSNEGSIQADQRNEKVIRQLYDNFSSHWNGHDTVALSGMWAIDGDHLEPDMTRVKGRADIAKMLKHQHQTVFKDTELDLNIDDVWFLGGGDIALIDGGYQLTGARMPDGTPLPARRGHLTSVLLYESGQWWIVASRLMVPAPLPYKKP